MKFTIIKSCLARFSGIFALGTPSNIHGTAISYRCAKFGAFVNSVTILTLRDLTIGSGQLAQTGKLVQESTVIISSGFNKEYKMAARQGFRVRKVHLSLLQERQTNLNLNQFLSF